MTKVDWLYETCIACLKPFEETGERRRSDAHAIPESLGGTLSLACLCAGRNKLIGGRYEDKLPLVETYANEMERFADIVPFFAKQLRKPGRTSVAQSEHGPLKMKRDRSDGAFRVVDTELESGRFKDSGDAGREFRQRLKKQGVSNGDRDAARPLRAGRSCAGRPGGGAGDGGAELEGRRDLHGRQWRPVPHPRDRHGGP
jgi:hypothetical protein